MTDFTGFPLDTVTEALTVEDPDNTAPAEGASRHSFTVTDVPGGELLPHVGVAAAVAGEASDAAAPEATIKIARATYLGGARAMTRP
jgi:hypothetical protein